MHVKIDDQLGLTSMAAVTARQRGNRTKRERDGQTVSEIPNQIDFPSLALRVDENKCQEIHIFFSTFPSQHRKRICCLSPLNSICIFMKFFSLSFSSAVLFFFLPCLVYTKESWTRSIRAASIWKTIFTPAVLRLVLCAALICMSHAGFLAP